MGLTKPIKEYEQDTLNLLELKYNGLKWCEFGNQRTDENEVAKNMYLSLGVKHISIDLNGEDDALPIDLDEPVPFILLNQFDVITNYGTIEHINNQFQVFKNIHDMSKQNGIIIHVLPPTGSWPKHCRYYYSEEFLEGLANACGYYIINCKMLDKSVHEPPRNLIAVTYIKKEDKGFVSKEEFTRIGGIKDTGDLSYTGNYTKRNRKQNIVIRIFKKLKAIFIKAERK